MTIWISTLIRSVIANAVKIDVRFTINLNNVTDNRTKMEVVAKNKKLNRFWFCKEQYNFLKNLFGITVLIFGVSNPFIITITKMIPLFKSINSFSKPPSTSKINSTGAVGYNFVVLNCSGKNLKSVLFLHQNSKNLIFYKYVEKSILLV